MPDRVRRPSDIYLLLTYALVAFLAISLGNLATSTTGALEQDLTQATGGLPQLLLKLFSWVAGVGVLILPVLVGVDLVIRSRWWQLMSALAGTLVAAGVAIGLKLALSEGQLTDMFAALARPLASEGRTNPLDIVVVSLVSFVVVANINGRRWLAPAAAVVLGSVALTGFLASAYSALALFCSFLLGAIVGHGTRLAFGTSPTRAPGSAVARELVFAGAPITRLELVDKDDEGERTYQGSTPDGVIDVRVLDRDTFGLASGRRLLGRLRLRGATARSPSLTLRAALEHRALQALALRWAGVTAPYPVAVCDVGGVSAAIAVTRVEGRTLAEIGASLTDEQAVAVLGMLSRLQDHRIAFRGLDRETVVILPDGSAGLRSTGDGDVGGDDISRRTDAARCQVMLALGMGAERSVSAAVAAIGAGRVAHTLPLLQPLALGRELRAALKAQPGLLDRLREAVLALGPAAAETESIELRRITIRGVLTAVGGAVAAYLLLTMLAQVDVAAVVSRASWPWALGSLVFASATFAGASLVLTGSVPTRLNFLHTYMTQLAVAFSGLVAPAAIGNVALNTRYLQKAGARASSAGASVALAQVAQFSSYATLLAISGVVAGTGSDASFQPPVKVVAAIPVVVAIGLGLFAVPRVRRVFREWVMPRLRTVVPQILGVLQRPAKLAQLLGGALLLDTTFVGALYCAARAFGSTSALAAVAVVYFAGAIIGSAVPTPGGLGGIEAALSAGLIAVGTDSGTAVSAVLLYRLVTYWLPIPFGWFSISRLQKLDAI
jgi:uncharacterized membrane protein YbhN (UPF0104 family)